MPGEAPRSVLARVSSWARSWVIGIIIIGIAVMRAVIAPRTFTCIARRTAITGTEGFGATQDMVLAGDPTDITRRIHDQTTSTSIETSIVMVTAVTPAMKNGCTNGLITRRMAHCWELWRG